MRLLKILGLKKKSTELTGDLAKKPKFTTVYPESKEAIVYKIKHKKVTFNGMIVAHLNEFGSITKEEAFKYYKIDHLSQIISKLKKDAGLMIESKTIEGNQQTTYILKGKESADKAG